MAQKAFSYSSPENISPFVTSPSEQFELQNQFELLESEICNHADVGSANISFNKEISYEEWLTALEHGLIRNPTIAEILAAHFHETKTPTHPTGNFPFQVEHWDPLTNPSEYIELGFLDVDRSQLNDDELDMVHDMDLQLESDERLLAQADLRMTELNDSARQAIESGQIFGDHHELGSRYPNATVQSFGLREPYLYSQPSSVGGAVHSFSVVHEVHIPGRKQPLYFLPGSLIRIPANSSELSIYNRSIFIAEDSNEILTPLNRGLSVIEEMQIDSGASARESMTRFLTYGDRDILREAVDEPIDVADYIEAASTQNDGLARADLLDPVPGLTDENVLLSEAIQRQSDIENKLFKARVENLETVRDAKIKKHPDWNIEDFKLVDIRYASAEVDLKVHPALFYGFVPKRNGEKQLVLLDLKDGAVYESHATLESGKTKENLFDLAMSEFVEGSEYGKGLFKYLKPQELLDDPAKDRKVVSVKSYQDADKTWDSLDQTGRYAMYASIALSLLSPEGFVSKFLGGLLAIYAFGELAASTGRDLINAARYERRVSPWEVFAKLLAIFASFFAVGATGAAMRRSFVTHNGSRVKFLDRWFGRRVRLTSRWTLPLRHRMHRTSDLWLRRETLLKRGAFTAYGTSLAISAKMLYDSLQINHPDLSEQDRVARLNYFVETVGLATATLFLHTRILKATEAGSTSRVTKFVQGTQTKVAANPLIGLTPPAIGLTYSVWKDFEIKADIEEERLAHKSEPPQEVITKIKHGKIGTISQGLEWLREYGDYQIDGDGALLAQVLIPVLFGVNPNFSEYNPDVIESWSFLTVKSLDGALTLAHLVLETLTLNRALKPNEKYMLGVLTFSSFDVFKRAFQATFTLDETTNKGVKAFRTRVRDPLTDEERVVTFLGHEADPKIGTIIESFRQEKTDVLAAMDNHSRWVRGEMQEHHPVLEEPYLELARKRRKAFDDSIRLDWNGIQEKLTDADYIGYISNPSYQSRIDEALAKISIDFTLRTQDYETVLRTETKKDVPIPNSNQAWLGFFAGFAAFQKTNAIQQILLPVPYAWTAGRIHAIGNAQEEYDRLKQPLLYCTPSYGNLCEDK